MTILENLINIVLLTIAFFTINVLNGLKQLKNKEVKNNEKDAIHTTCSDDFIGK
jgi:hypothetical protein